MAGGYGERQGRGGRSVATEIGRRGQSKAAPVAVRRPAPVPTTRTYVAEQRRARVCVDPATDLRAACTILILTLALFTK